MEQSLLIELIRTLHPEEKEHILQFTAFSFFNHGRMKTLVKPLLEICLRHSWDDPLQNLDKKEVFATLFPDQKFVEGKLEKVMVEAHKVVRSFLMLQYYFREDNEFFQNFDFSEIVRARGLYTRHQQLLVKLQKIQQQIPWKNTTYLYRQFLLEKSIHDDHSLYNQTKGDLNVPNVLLALETHFHLNRLALLNRFLLQQKVAVIDDPETFKYVLDEISIPKIYLEYSPTLEVNNAIYSILRINSPKPSDIRFLFDLLLSQEKNLSPESLREFYTYLRSISVLISNKFLDSEEIRVTLYELYKDNLSRGYLHYEGKLHPSTYLAVSVAAVRVNQFDWAIEFIEKHKHEVIGENESQDLYRLNLAHYLFGIGKYSECLDNIPATSAYVDYLLQGKRLELKALYELQSELLSYKLDAFKMFLSRTSQKFLSENRQQTHSDFGNLLHQLVYSNPGDPKRSELLIKRIQEKKQAAEWRWLLEKAKALNVK